MTEIQSVLEDIASLPAYPSLGIILRKFADISGMTEKELDPSKGFRKKLNRLAGQKEKEIDLDNYQEVLWEIIDRFETITETYPFHWIAGSQVYHYFSAYQQLIIHLPVLSILQEDIDSIIGMNFLIWSTLRYVRWQQQYPGEADTHTGNWWIKNTNPIYGLQQVFINLKKLLGDENMSTWALVRTIFNHIDLTKDQHTERQRQFDRWLKGDTKPHYAKVLEHIIEPLRKNNRKVSIIFEVDFLCWRWISVWTDFISMKENSIGKILDIFYQKAQRDSDVLNTIIPGKGIMFEKDIITFFRNTFSMLIPEFDNKKLLEYWKEANNSFVEAFSNFGRFNATELTKLYDVFEYRHGILYNGIAHYIFQSQLQGDSPYLEKVFKSLYLHGLIQDGFRESKSWLLFQKEDKPNLILKNLALIVQDETIDKWLCHWTADNIDEFRVLGGFSRTRLMVAAYRGDIAIIQKLMNGDADQCILSEDSNDSYGDFSSPILLSMLSFETPVTSLQKENSFKIIKLLLNNMKKISPDLVKLVLNTTQRITRRTPLGIAIEMGNSVFLSQLLELGADPNMKIGGDDSLPVYDAVSAIYRYKKYRSGESFLQRPKTVNMNAFRMETPPEALEMIKLQSGQETLNRLMDKSIESTNHNKPGSLEPYFFNLKQLVRNGANLNRLDNNGRYPLDMAMEIEDAKLIRHIKKLGAYKRTIY